MTFTRYFAVLFLQMAVFALIRLFFFNVTGFENALYFYLYLFALYIFSVALSRRLGVINYLEAMFTCVLWLFTNLFVDLLFTSKYLGTDIFTGKELWLGYLVILIGLFFFHKKRHVQVRKELHAKHHGRH